MDGAQSQFAVVAFASNASTLDRTFRGTNHIRISATVSTRATWFRGITRRFPMIKVSFRLDTRVGGEAEPRDGERARIG